MKSVQAQLMHTNPEEKQQQQQDSFSVLLPVALFWFLSETRVLSKQYSTNAFNHKCVVFSQYQNVHHSPHSSSPVSTGIMSILMVIHNSAPHNLHPVQGVRQRVRLWRHYPAHHRASSLNLTRIFSVASCNLQALHEARTVIQHNSCLISVHLISTLLSTDDPPGVLLSYLVTEQHLMLALFHSLLRI